MQYNLQDLLLARGVNTPLREGVQLILEKYGKRTEALKSVLIYLEDLPTKTEEVESLTKTIRGALYES